jgi:heme exporter protein A
MRVSDVHTDEWAIDVRGLTKSYGDNPALRHIDLQVKRGEFLTIFGPNGAGKTTLLKVLSTLVKPSSGSARVGGFDLNRDSRQVRRQIGVVSHQTLLYDDLTAHENLSFYGKMYDVPHLSERIHQLLSDVGLEARAHDRLHTFSRGMQQRVAIARALIHDPAVVLLDEPGTGLDEYANAMLADILSSTGHGQRTVLMTTHSLEQGLALSSRIAILAQGKIAHEGPRQMDIQSLREIYRECTEARN